MRNIITWPYILRSGHSHDPSQGACAMDAVNWLVHGKHGAAPECACSVIAAYVIGGNDAMPDDIRQRLLPYLHRIAGSKSAVHEAARIRILVLAALRVFAPPALDGAGLHDHAAKLRGLADDVDMNKAEARASEAAAAARAEARASEARASEAAAAEAAARASEAAAWAAAAAAARPAARAAAGAAAGAAEASARWDDYFIVLDAALNAGSQGEPWSIDVVQQQVAAFDMAAL